jgi:hypothetical protein
MAIKHVKETLGQFQDWKYFSVLEEKSEEKVESGDDKKLKDEEAKDGIEAIKKLRDNLSRFETAAGGKIIKYKEFWEENQEVADGFDEEGNVYKLWDSDYVAGVLVLPDQALSDDELNAEIELVDQAGGDEDEDEETTDEESEETEEEDEDEEEDKDEEEDEDKEEGDEEEDEELEEGNAFGKAVKNAKKKGKKDFKVGGKKFPVKESWRPEGEVFRLFEADEEEAEEEEVEEEKPEETEGDFAGFDPDTLDAEGGEGEETGEEVEVEDGEAIELDGDLDGDGEVEGGMEFGGEGESHEFFVIFDMNGNDRDEVFRTDDPKVIEEFKDFFENEWKATVRNQIQQFKEAQEEKKREAETKAKEAIRQERKGKLEKFMKESVEETSAYGRLKMQNPEWNWEEAENEISDEDLEAASDYYDRMNQNEAFDADNYEEPYVLDGGDGYDEYEEEYDEDYDQEYEFDHWKEYLVDLLIDDYGMEMDEAKNAVEEEDLFEAFEDEIPLEDIAAGIYDKYQ